MKEDQKTVVVGAKSYEALWAKTLAACPRGKPAGDGWKTAQEIALLRGSSVAAASQWVRSQKNMEAVDGSSERGLRCFYYRPRAR